MIGIADVVNSLYDYRSEGEDIPEDVLDRNLEICETLKTYLNLKKASFVRFIKSKDETVRGSVLSVDISENKDGSLLIGITVQGPGNNTYRITSKDLVGLEFKRDSGLADIFA